MIGYCPLEEELTVVRTPPHYKPPPPPPKNPDPYGLLDGENTECNYLVLFFILGVFVLAGTDVMKR